MMLSYRHQLLPYLHSGMMAGVTALDNKKAAMLLFAAYAYYHGCPSITLLGKKPSCKNEDAGRNLKVSVCQ